VLQENGRKTFMPKVVRVVQVPAVAGCGHGLGDVALRPEQLLPSFEPQLTIPFSTAAPLDEQWATSCTAAFDPFRTTLFVDY